MLRSAIGRGGRGSKGAHNRETLQTTGFYVGRIVIVPREFAPIPHAPAGFPIPIAIRMRFLRHDGIYRSDVVQNKNKPWGGTVPPPAGRPRAQVKERVGRTTLLSSSAMSSGRLFLDRVGRHQSPSPLHRHGQNNSVARSEGTNYHRTVSSVLTVCVSSGGRRNKTQISHACFFATTTAKKTEGDNVLLVRLGHLTLENLGHFLACEFFGWCYGYTPRMSAATEEPSAHVPMSPRPDF